MSNAFAAELDALILQSPAQRPRQPNPAAFAKAAKAYRTAAKLTLTGEELERETLLQAASKLHAASKVWPPIEDELHPALAMVAKVWRVLGARASHPSSGMSRRARVLTIKSADKAIQLATALLSAPTLPTINALTNLHRQTAADLNRM